jgi:hypothetical protein
MNKNKKGKENETVEVEVAVGEVNSTPVRVKRSLTVKQFLTTNAKSSCLSSLLNRSRTDFNQLDTPILIPEVSEEALIGTWHDIAHDKEKSSPPRVLYTFKKIADNEGGMAMTEQNFAILFNSFKEQKIELTEQKNEINILKTRMKTMENTFFNTKMRTAIEYYRILLITRHQQKYEESLSCDGQLSWNIFFNKIKPQLKEHELLSTTGFDSNYFELSKEIHSCSIAELEILAMSGKLGELKEQWSKLIREVMENKTLIDETIKSLRHDKKI